MYAIIEVAGQQFKVKQDQKIYVHRLAAEVGDKLDIEKVLLVDNEGSITVGTPTVDGAKVSANVLAHVRADKIKVFKKKRRKGYQKETGHRQDLTQIKIESIVL
ncbi:MAG: 50S ribosomal protein L21 [Lentimicrobiaceae bacterium]|nr:50S ribosomal protein L21 [Lentimicrobiaceae bacterium]